MNTIVRERNGVAFEAVPQTIIRGAARGQLYLAFVPTEENLADYVNFLGKKEAVDILARAAKANGQAALDYTLGDAGWQKRVVADAETGKELEQEFYDADSVNWDQVVDTILSGAVKGGVTAKELREEREDMVKQMTALYTAASTNPNFTTEQRAAAFSEGISIAAKIAELEAAIEAKKRTRRSDEK
jgi:hypothetical protein